MLYRILRIFKSCRNTKESIHHYCFLPIWKMKTKRKEIYEEESSRPRAIDNLISLSCDHSSKTQSFT